MKLLDRYIGTRVLSGYVLVMVILIAVLTLLMFVRELDEIGKGQYGLLEVCIFAVLTMPRRMVEVAPVTALLGSIIGLGQLANGRELLAMLCAGISPLRVAWSVLRMGALLMLGVVVFEEFVAPPADQLALARRSQAMAEMGALRTQTGFWSRDGRQFVNVRQILHGQIPSSIDIYQFDEEGQLREFSHARRANAEDPRYWVLMDVEQKIIGEQNLTVKSLKTLLWESFLTPEQIGLLIFPVETLSLSDLYYYVKYLRDTEQSAEDYELSLWQKVSMPLATGSMILIAIPFMLGPLRVASTGKRILIGSILAIAFYLISRVIAHLAIVFHFNPILTTIGPAVLILGIALWMFQRIR